MEDWTTEVRAVFFLSGEKIDLDDVISTIKIDNYTAKSIFPKNSIGHPYWLIKTEKIITRSIEEPLRMLIDILKPWQKEILDLKEKYSLNTTFAFSVFFEDHNHPELVIPPDLNDFIHSLGAEIGIDLCY